MAAALPSLDMDFFEAVARRRSHKMLVAPAPDEAALERILQAAAAAPDHQLLRPWRFVIITGDAKDELSRRSIEELVRRQPSITDGKVDKERRKLDRAPMVIAVAAAHVETKLPFSELVAAANAAVQNLLLAATALGFGTIWRSGAAVDDPWLKTELGLKTTDQLVAFVYIGTVPEEAAPAERPDGLVGTVWRYSPS